LPAAQSLCDERKLANGEQTRFESVLAYRNTHDALEKVGLDLTSIEDLFGLVDLDYRVDASAAETRKDLIFLILKTLEKMVHTEELQPHQVWFRDGNQRPGMPGANRERQVRPSEHFVDLVARRWEAKPQNGLAKDAIISLNYDLVIERAMASRSLVPHYHLFPGDSGGNEAAASPEMVGINYLKLHGSANWAICPNCHNQKVYPPDQAMLAHLGLRRLRMRRASGAAYRSPNLEQR
jgi:hypothetical protein